MAYIFVLGTFVKELLLLLCGYQWMMSPTAKFSVVHGGLRNCHESGVAPNIVSQCNEVSPWLVPKVALIKQTECTSHILRSI